MKKDIEKMIICLFASAVAICLLYELTDNMAEVFTCGGALIKFLAQISYSIIASCIFYYITVNLNERIKKQRFKGVILKRLIRIQTTMKWIMQSIFQDNQNIDNITEAEIYETLPKLHFFDTYQGKTFLDYFGKEAVFIENTISELYGKFSFYINDEDLLFLEDILGLQFIMTMSHVYKNKIEFDNNPDFGSYCEYLNDFNHKRLELETVIRKYRS